MPDYCNNIVDVNSVPGIDDMIDFVPYFEVPDGCTSIEVYIRVPSNCYNIVRDVNSAPTGGPCGDPGDLQHTIILDLKAGCTNTTPTILRKTLNYREDPSGNYLYVYTVDNSTGGNVGGGSKGSKKVRN